MADLLPANVDIISLITNRNAGKPSTWPSFKNINTSCFSCSNVGNDVVVGFKYASLPIVVCEKHPRLQAQLKIPHHQ